MFLCENLSTNFKLGLFLSRVKSILDGPSRSKLASNPLTESNIDINGGKYFKSSHFNFNLTLDRIKFLNTQKLFASRHLKSVFKKGNLNSKYFCIYNHDKHASIESLPDLRDKNEEIIIYTENKTPKSNNI